MKAEILISGIASVVWNNVRDKKFEEMKSKNDKSIPNKKITIKDE
jgi:hypothetical protein